MEFYAIKSCIHSIEGHCELLKDKNEDQRCSKIKHDNLETFIEE